MKKNFKNSRFVERDDASYVFFNLDKVKAKRGRLHPVLTKNYLYLRNRYIDVMIRKSWCDDIDKTTIVFDKYSYDDLGIFKNFA